MLEFIIFLLLAVVVPVVVNKTTEAGHLNWIKPHLRLVWTGIFLILSIYLLDKQGPLEITMSLHKRWSEVALLGYVAWGAVGAVTLCAYWWLTGKMVPSVAPPETRATPIAKATDEKPPTLAYLFKNDFPSVLKSTSDDTGIRWKDGTVLNIKRQIYLDFPAKTQLLAFYIPASILPPNNNKTFNACMILVDAVKPAIEGLPKTIHITGGDAGGVTSMEELVFSGRVFIYHEDALSNKQKPAIINAFDAKHYDVQLRGTDYLTPQLIAWYHEHGAKGGH